MGGLTRSENMALIRSRSTLPEIKLRTALWKEGFRYRLEYKLPGRPDITFIAAKLAVFVDGCFWHGCPLHYSAPASREKFWAQKLRANVERDLAVDNALSRMEWRYFHVWQHDLRDVNQLVQAIASLLRKSPLSYRVMGPHQVDPNASLATEFRTFRHGMVSPWYSCVCGSTDVRVLAVSGPGSLRPNAKRRPQWAELVCVKCRQAFQRNTSDQQSNGNSVADGLPG